ncbi:MAG: wax ester/triacylglycerol synthase family O-acyltransferase [Mycobacterium sp.]
MAEFMRNSDAFTYQMESDPRLRSTIVTVLMMDGTPDWDVLRERFDAVSRTLPMFRQRVVSTPGGTPPRWEPVVDFDLDYHVRRVGAPEPATFEGVLEMARLAQMEAFDPARPMWQATLVDGLENGGSALLCKVHHALTDGVGGVQIGLTLFDLSATPRRREPLPDPPAAARPGALAGYRDALRYNLGLVGRAVSGGIRAVPTVLAGGLRSPLGTIGSVTATAASVYRTVRPVNRTGSGLMTERDLTRRLAVLDVPKAGLREAAHRAGGALNDAFVAGVAGGLRLYHEKHGCAVGDLHLSMPINLRHESDPMGGNRITLMRFDVPVGVADPAQRIAAIHERTSRVRDEPSLPLTQTIAGALNLMPRWYIGSILRNVDFVASDVPGVPVPVFLGGATVRAQYAFGPTIGSALNVTLLTYVDTCAVGINVDTAAIPDHDLLQECLSAGFDEVLALAGE